MIVGTRTSDDTWRVGPHTTVHTDGGPPMHPSELAELRTLHRFVSTSPYKEILGSLAGQRNICSREKYLYDLCAKRYPSHLAPKFCAPTAWEQTRCMMKLCVELNSKRIETAGRMKREVVISMFACRCPHPGDSVVAGFGCLGSLQRTKDAT